MKKQETDQRSVRKQKMTAAVLFRVVFFSEMVRTVAVIHFLDTRTEATTPDSANQRVLRFRTE